MKTYYRNHLPHLTPIGGCFFITFCTQDSIPIHKNIVSFNKSFINTFYENGRKHEFKTSQIDLTFPAIANTIKDTIEKYDNTFYELLYFTIMPNHVHLIFNTGFRSDPEPLHNIMRHLKGSSSRAINLILKRSGTFWQKDSYDHLIRTEKELSDMGDYIVENPVKASKVTKWEDWPWTYVKYI